MKNNDEINGITQNFLKNALESERLCVNYEEDNYDAGRRDAMYDWIPAAIKEGIKWSNTQYKNDLIKVKVKKTNEIITVKRGIFEFADKNNHFYKEYELEFIEY